MDAVERAAALRAHAEDTAGCTRCALAQGRTQVVFGSGSPDADLMFVGEAPGFHEDQQGIPFVGQAGKLLDKLLGGIGMTLLIPAIVVSNFAVLIGLFALSTFSYAAWSTMGLTFPADLYPNRTVATVSGMSGAAAGVGTILSTLAIGKITDRYSFEPVLIGASLLPVIATVLVFVLIRPARHDKTVI